MMRDVVTTPERRAAYERSGLWDHRTLAGQVARWAGERPAAVAVVDDQEARTYAELGADAARIAGFLAEVGVDAGSVVSVQLPNRYAAVVTAVAAQALGAVINPLLPSYRAKELRYVFDTARPRVVVTPAGYRGFDHRDLVAEVRDATGLELVHLVVDDDAGGGDARFAELLGRPPGVLGSPRADAVSELIFTSGTEATPKAIMHTEQTTNFSVRVAASDLGVGPDDVVWMPSPVGHSTGFNYGLRFALYHGLRLVLQDRWDADHAVALVQEQRCTHTLAATTFLQDLVDAAGRAGAQLGSLRGFGCGGAPVPPELVRAAHGEGSGCYGSTGRPRSWSARGTDPSRPPTVRTPPTASR